MIFDSGVLSDLGAVVLQDQKMISHSAHTVKMNVCTLLECLRTNYIVECYKLNENINKTSFSSFSLDNLFIGLNLLVFLSLYYYCGKEKEENTFSFQYTDEIHTKDYDAFQKCSPVGAPNYAGIAGQVLKS
uniref:Uncharacterized protein n=1 Tax=Glossina pallidipes TaxID=7398 RepID=A0A1B0A2V9_GLOPL